MDSSSSAEINPAVRLVVVIPVGPTCREEDSLDTIESVCHYTAPGRRIIIADDSANGMGQTLQRTVPELEVVTTPRNLGKYGGLYVNLSLAFAHAVKTGRFDVLLRMDTDALIIGERPEDEAHRLFTEQPEIGLAGQYPLTYDGRPWDYSWETREMAKFNTRFLSLLRRPAGVWALRKVLRVATRDGFKIATNVFGGANCMSEDCVRKLHAANLLPMRGLGGTRLQEDHLFGPLVWSVGKRFGDLASGRLPFGCAWIGLPDSPANLVAAGKKVIHSIRSWGDMKEPEIRAYFRERRRAGPAARAN